MGSPSRDSLQPQVREIEQCRLCGSKRLTVLYSLGDQYVNDFVSPGCEKDGILCPITLTLCEDCTLVQLTHTAPQSILYEQKYWYKTGTNQTLRDEMEDIVTDISRRITLSPGDVVLDIGSNDGTLLREYPRGLVRVGVEPARNLQEEGRQGVDHLIQGFWGDTSGLARKYYARSVGDYAKVITAIGMFYDLDNPLRFVKQAAQVLADDGLFVAQLMCLQNMVDLEDVGNLCHEHLEYYSMNSLEYLFSKAGLRMIDIEESTLNGKSYRIYAVKSGSPIPKTVDGQHRLAEAHYREIQPSLADPQVHREMFARMEANKRKTVDYIRARVKEGKRVWVYGASTKGNVLLQYYGLDHTLIEGASDRNPDKWGKVTIGTGIPIYSEEEARKFNPDFFLVLPYFFIDEFMEREKAWLQGGGHFMVALPEFKVLY